MRESTVVKEWQAEGRQEGLDAMRRVLISLLRKRFPNEVSEDIVIAVQNETDFAKLTHWHDAIYSASALDEVRAPLPT